MFTENVMWLLGAYLAGSCATWYLFLRQNFLKATEATIDSLIDNGFLRYKRGDDGEDDGMKVRLLPIRPRSRGARRSLRTFPVVTLHPRFPFNV